jgi:hypothetical protein
MVTVVGPAGSSFAMLRVSQVDRRLRGGDKNKDVAWIIQDQESQLYKY